MKKSIENARHKFFLETIKTYFFNIVSSIIFWSFLLTVVFAFYVHDLFPKYNISINKTTFANDVRIIYADLNGDNLSEKIELRDKYTYKTIAIYDQNEQLFFSFNFVKDIVLRGFENYFIEDYDNNAANELYVVTQKKDSVFVTSFICNKKNKISMQEKFITTINKNFKNEYDFTGYFLQGKADFNEDGYKEINIFLIAGYSYFPRMIYAYDVKNDTIYNSVQDGIFMIPYLINNKANNKNFFVSSSFAVSNFNKNFDTIPLHDTSAWLKILDHKLQYLFEPIEFVGQGGLISTKYVERNDSSYFCVFSGNFRTSSKLKMFLYSVDGKIVCEFEQLNLTHNEVVFIDGYFEEPVTNLLFADKNNYAYFLNDNFTQLEKHKIDFSQNECCKAIIFYDMDCDGTKEIVFVGTNEIVIYRNDFSHPCKLHLDTETYRHLSIYKQTTQQELCLQADELLYFLSYYKNSRYYLQYIFIAGFFGFFLIFLYFIQKIRTLKLEKENIRLNNIVQERTQEIKIQKEEIEKQTDHLKKLVEKLKNLDHYKQDLTSMIIHDLKNPLNYIINFNEHNQTAQAGRIMLNMVMNLLDIHKFEETQMVLHQELNNLNNTLHKAVKQIEYLLEEKNITLLNYLNTQIEAKYDSEIMERVFINLISNAIKYSPQNEKIIIQSTIKEEKSGSFVLVEIIDKGKGIPEHFIPKIFDKFSQNEAKSIGIARSTGLGLTFCKYAIEVLGGEIMVTSKLGEGSIFSFTIPVENYLNIEKPEVQTFHQKEQHFFLTKQEKDFLKPYIDQLKFIEFYSFSELIIIINEIDDKQQETILQWKKAVKAAIENFNELKYNQLIDLNDEIN